MLILLLILLSVSILLEGTMTTLPFVLIVLLISGIARRSTMVFSLAFFAGLILDLLTVRLLGSTALFFLLFLFLIFLYQKKYEINSYPFVLVSSFAGAILYLNFFDYNSVFVQAGISSVIALILFSGFKIAKINL